MKLHTQSVLCTAAYIAMGACQNATVLQRAVDQHGAGQDGYIGDIVTYAPYVEMLWNAALKVEDFDTPSVWYYDVCESFGQWVTSTYMERHGRLDEGLNIDEVLTGLKKIVEDFFFGGADNRHHSRMCRVKLRAAMDAVSPDSIGAQAHEIEF